MPTHTTELVAKRTTALKKKLSDNLESMSPVQIRELKKRIRRSQRKHARLQADIDRKAGAGKKDEKDEKKEG